MNSLILSALLVTSPGDPARRDVEDLRGTWVLVETEQDGVLTRADGRRTLEVGVRDGPEMFSSEAYDVRVVNRVGDRVEERGAMRLDPTTSPKQLAWESHRDGVIRLPIGGSIYRLDGNLLTIRLAIREIRVKRFVLPGFGPPPPDREPFRTRPGDGYQVLVYRRQSAPKPDGPSPPKLDVPRKSPPAP